MAYFGSWIVVSMYEFCLCVYLLIESKNLVELIGISCFGGCIVVFMYEFACVFTYLSNSRIYQS